VTASQLVEAALPTGQLERAQRRSAQCIAAATGGAIAPPFVAAGGLGSWHAEPDDRIVCGKLSAYQEVVEVRTGGRGFSNITRKVQEVVARSGKKTALCTVFIQHTSASLVIQENADPNVLRDLGDWIEELAPESRAWVHDDEGPDDMPAHARSAITKTSETVPVTDGQLALGTWQGLYVWEHRARPHTRRVVVHVAD